MQPEETLYVDDRPANIRGAESVGIRGVLFTTARHLKRDLRAAGVGVA